MTARDTTHRRPPRDPRVSHEKARPSLLSTTRGGTASRCIYLTTGGRGQRPLLPLAACSPHVLLTLLHSSPLIVVVARSLSLGAPRDSPDGRAAWGAVLQDLPPPRSPVPRRRSPRFARRLRSNPSFTSDVDILLSATLPKVLRYVLCCHGILLGSSFLCSQKESVTPYVIMAFPVLLL